MSTPNPGPLGKAADALSAALEEAEAALADLRLGVTGDVPLGTEGHVLSWEKQGGTWLLAVRRSLPGQADSYAPLLKASLAHRTLAAEALVTLYAVLLERRREETERVANAATRAKAFADTLRRVEKP